MTHKTSLVLGLSATATIFALPFMQPSAQAGSSPLVVTPPHMCPPEIAPPPVPVCQGYNIPLDNNPTSNQMLRDAYKSNLLPADSCYVSALTNNTFVCYVVGSGNYHTACNDFEKVPPLAGAAAIAQYACKIESGVLRYYFDASNSRVIDFQNAPARSTTTVDNGKTYHSVFPYSNLNDNGTPGQPFTAAQVSSFRAMNGAADAGHVHSDLEGFSITYVDSTGTTQSWTEPHALSNSAICSDLTATVRRIFPAGDEFGCAWGPNGSSNAMIISRKLSEILGDKPPTNAELAKLKGPYPLVP